MKQKDRERPNDRGGKNFRRFSEGITGLDAHSLVDRTICRDYVRSFVGTNSNSILAKSAAIMAWGGMRPSHRDLAFNEETRGDWLAVADAIRNGKYDRGGAYDAFRKLREDKSLKGMGPAYFTKLIHFLSPKGRDGEPQAYIMDQWAGCSVNVLAGEELVLMDSTGSWKRKGEQPYQDFSFRVSDANTGENYDDFCSVIDALRLKLSESADQIDRSLKSTGGRNAAKWRTYVRQEHRRFLNAAGVAQDG